MGSGGLWYGNVRQRLGAIGNSVAGLGTFGILKPGVGHPVGIICLDDLYRYLTEETITLAGAVLPDEGFLARRAYSGSTRRYRR